MDALAAVGASDLVSGVTVLLAAIFGVVVARRLVAAPSFGQLGCTALNGHRAELLLGIVLGPLAFGTVLALGVFMNRTRIAPGGLDPAALLVVGLTLACVAAGEELMMRGVVLQQVTRGWGARAGVIVSSLLFTLLHLPNLFTTEVRPLVGAIALAVLLLLGIVLGLGALLTRSLWLPIALHGSWNFAQGPLFGLAISGHPSNGLLQLDLTGADWVTGGSFGPEGGLVGLLAVALCGAVLGAYARASGVAGGAASQATPSTP
jgi:membrane protease YdiL (CAAX protease family)